MFGIWLVMMTCPPGAAQEKADDPATWKKMVSDAELEQELRWIRAEAEAEIVTATKRKIPVGDAPAIATVITAVEIKNMGARDLMDVLKTVPGFGVSINPSGGYMFEVRGVRTSENEKILLMIDGHRMNNPYWGSGLGEFNTLAVENVKQIEVIRGPGSALYGANAFVAAINVITKDAGDTEGLGASAAAGSFDTKKFSIVGGRSFEKFKIAGSIYRADSDGPALIIDADRFTGKPYSKTPGKSDSYFEQTEVFLKASYGNLNFKGQYFEKERGTYIGYGNALTEGSVYPHKNFWAELAYSHSFTDKSSANFRIYYDYFEETDKARLAVFPEGYPGFPQGMCGYPSFKNRTAGTEIQYDLDLFKGNHLIAGFNYEYVEQYDVTRAANFNPWTGAPLGSRQDISSWGNFNKDVTRKIWAFYIQDEWEIRENLNLIAGVRHDRYDDFGGTTNPRLGLVWSFFRDADLKLLYGQAFRAPSFQELYNDGNPAAIGDPNLQPEEIKTYEASLGYRLKNSHSISLTYFHNDIDKLIVRDAGAPAYYSNKRGANDGIEVGLSGRYSSDNYWKLNYTLQDPRDADTDRDLPNVPSQRASFSVNYEVCKYLNAHADVLWTGKRPRVSGDDRGDMPSYTTVDLTLIAKNFCKGFEIRGMVHNLFDTEYEDPDLSGDQKLIPYDYPREGISALLEFSYRF